MPRFPCPECGEKFNSRKKKEEHVQVEHGGEVDDAGNKIPLTQRISEAFTLKRFGVIFGMLLMIGLPLGGTVFYSHSGGSGGVQSSSDSYSSNPPVGYSMRQLPEAAPSDMPSSQILKEPLSKNIQLNVLVRGGKEQIGRVKPAVLLQYSCNCPEIAEELRSIAQKYPGWVYVAPYRDMNSTISYSAFRKLDKVEEVKKSEAEQFICSALNNRPVQCLSESFSSNSSLSSS